MCVILLSILRDSKLDETTFAKSRVPQASDRRAQLRAKDMCRGLQALAALNLTRALVPNQAEESRVKPGEALKNPRAFRCAVPPRMLQEQFGSFKGSRVKPRDARQHEQIEQPAAVDLVPRSVAMRFASFSSGAPERSSGSAWVSDAESVVND